MKTVSVHRSVTAAVAAFAVLALGVTRASAQSEEIKQHIAALKQTAAANKQALVHYTWQEKKTVSLKGEVKSSETFQVRFGPDGKPVKTAIDSTKAKSGGRKHGIKHRIVEKKKGEYAAYGEQLGALAQLYAHPDPAKLQAAFEAGKVAIGPSGVADHGRLVIHDYAKTGDTVTIEFVEDQDLIVSVDIQSYLDAPTDKANISVQYARIPDGPSHPSTITVDGVSKQLQVGIQNSDYEKL